MVLTQVLRPLSLVAWIALVAGCGQSLFDAHGEGRDGGSTGGDGDVPDTCQTPCLADAGADFDGSPGGKGDHWRYLDDHRDRTWLPMVADAGAQVGADPGNSFKRCAGFSSSSACEALPGALLVTTAGKTSAADPAIEYRVEEPRVIQIAVRAHVESGGPAHAIRLYRNSREDVLFTLPTVAGATVERQITVDAIPGDRFLIAAAPGDAGGAVALHVFVSDPRKSFPVTCQLAVPFTAQGSSSTTVDDLCRGELQSITTGAPSMPSLLAGPYSELGMGAYLENSYYDAGEPLTAASAMTIQLWLRAEGSMIAGEWVISNINADVGGGLGLQLKIDPTDGLVLEASGVKTTNPATYAGPHAPYGTPFEWHFVRVVHASGQIGICVDGERVGGDALAGPVTSSAPVNIGRNASDSGSYLTGDVDDVRVFLEALPCE